MKSVRLNPASCQRFVEKFHSYNHPGAYVRGLSQSGKTASVGTIIQEQIRQHRSITVIDPHDQLRRRLTSYVLTLPLRRRRDLNLIVPADGLHVSVNPLAWTEVGEIPVTASETRLMLKQAFGDAILSQTQPNIDYWMDYALRATAWLRLPLTLAPEFLDRTSDIHPELVQAISALNSDIGNKLALIEKMNLHEYITIVVPALKRLETLLKDNPHTRDLLSNTESLDMRDFIRPGAINLISLKLTNSATKRQILRVEDRRFLACLYGKAVYRAIYARDEKDRTCDHTIWLDELKVFESIFGDIETGMREAAKFKLKCGGIIQDTSSLDGQEKSPVHCAFLNNAHFQLYFRTQGADTQSLSYLPHLLTWHPRKVRHIHKRNEQYIAGHKVEVVRSRHFDWSSNKQDGTSMDEGEDIGASVNEDTGVTNTEKKSLGTRKSTNTVITNHENQSQNPNDLAPTGFGSGSARANGTSEDKSEEVGTASAKSHKQGRGQSRSFKRGRGSNKSRGSQRSGGIAFGESLLPIYRNREVVQSVELLSENQHHLGWQRIIASLPVGECVAIVSGLGVAHFAFPMPYDSTREFASYLRSQLPRFLTQLVGRPVYLDPSAFSGQYSRLIETLHRQLLSDRRRRSQQLLKYEGHSDKNNGDSDDSNPHLVF